MYVLGITSGAIPDWYWYKAGIASDHTRLVCSSISVFLPVPSYSQAAPDMQV
jgi:hypothetical protein